MAQITEIVHQLRKERARVHAELQKLDQAIAALSQVSGANNKGRIRTMSAAARKRIAAAQRARWAKFRASSKKTA
jgi:hypothetical protein